jgi:hypothetical protein
VNDLERRLVGLGRDLELPASPDLVPTIRSRLEPRRAALPGRRWVLALALIALAGLAATLAIPDARSALLRALHIGGAQIELVDELPEVPAPFDLELALGERVTIEEARQGAGFQLRELDEAPDRVYLGDRGTVWFLYGTPEDVRLLVAQTPFHSVDQPALVKKLRTSETSAEPLLVEGAEGVYVSGEPHFLFLVDDLGNPVEDSARLARNVLLWDSDGIAFRLEGDLTRERALELAEELR